MALRRGFRSEREKISLEAVDSLSGAQPAMKEMICNTSLVACQSRYSVLHYRHNIESPSV